MEIFEEEELSSNDEYHIPHSDAENNFESDSDDFYEADIYFLLRKFKEKLFWHHPTSCCKLWVLWNPTHSSCLPSPDSVGIEEKIKSGLQKLSVKHLFDPVLIQFWAVVTNEGHFLTTSGQPFGLYDIDEKLCLYRNHSLDYKFFVEGQSEEDLGFPARVYRQKWPESTPNVHYYSTKQHPWCKHALDYKNLALLALPVFEVSGKFCVGVLELVGPVLHPDDIKAICTALEAVDLKCLGRPCNHFDKNTIIVNQIGNKGLQHALNEINQVFEVLCETHQLPLAQTWVLCKDCDAGASPRIAFSKIYDACYGTDIDAYSFLDDTVVLPLHEDQGVVGRAYSSSHNSSFCTDLTQFSLTEYPMVHYARYHKFFGCFAICLKSSYTGEDDYILELFLPPNERIYEHPRPRILYTILATMKQHFHSFKVASGDPVGVELSVEEINFSVVKKLDPLQICQTATSLPRPEALQNREDIAQVNSSDQQFMVQDDAIENDKNISNAEESDTAGTNSGRKSTKRELEITREDLENNFGRKLEVVAKIYKVSRSTFKRICREHGIPRWPRRKMDKVNDSLSMQDPPQDGQATVSHTRPSIAMQDACTHVIERRFMSHPPPVDHSSDLIQECMTILNDIEDINGIVYTKTLRILHDDHTWRKMFLAMPAHRRKEWIFTL
ncbi:hypothetical protein F0562_020153 [Nyssa sinensis]|uniref:RWP-RK domain-containing protein n=1 Tax=Nyssa sinensis TaxID=561372 RepID=A0A5J5BR26_9ASTE|nr:hypothetical protein F0562_020153 [Nyssa sinensis]